jgi:hypothetical protein
MNQHQESLISLPAESILSQVVFPQQFSDFKCNLVCLCQSILPYKLQTIVGTSVSVPALHSKQLLPYCSFKM